MGTLFSPTEQSLTSVKETFTHICIGEENRVEPLRSKIFSPDQAFLAAPLAFLFALGLYGLGR